MIELISDRLWPRLKAQAKKTKRRSYVAVAFLSPGAFERLRLRPGSLLIVNCNEATVKGCQTDPREVKKYLDHGVVVHNVSNLHAKVFVLGSKAFVGSSNVSSSSETLLEAAVASSSRDFVRDCKDFVRSLAGEVISPAELQRLIPLFDPHKFNRRVNRRPKPQERHRIVPKHNPLWAVRTHDGTWQDADYEAESAAMPVAEERLTSSDFKVETFRWSGGNSTFFHDVRSGDVVIEVHHETLRKVFLQPPQKVILVRRYKQGKRLMIFLEQKKRLRKRSMGEIRTRLPSAARFLGTVRMSKIIKQAQLVHDVQHLWSH